MPGNGAGHWGYGKPKRKKHLSLYQLNDRKSRSIDQSLYEEFKTLGTKPESEKKYLKRVRNVWKNSPTFDLKMKQHAPTD